MYIDGDYVENKKPFSELHSGPATAHYVIRAQEMDDKRWAEVFHCLNAVLARKRQVECANHGGPQPSETRQPIPESDTESDFPDHPPEDETSEV